MEDSLKRKELRHDRHTYHCSQTTLCSLPSISRILREEFPHLKDWCGEHLRAPSCFHGSVGQGWEVVQKYIETQDKHHAKPIATGFVH